VSIGRAIRLAAIDFYFNSLRFVPANAAWALGALVVLFLAVAWPPAIVLGALLAIPLAGLHRMAALLARGEATSLSDFVDGMRRFGAAAAVVATGAVVLGFVLTTNMVVGFESGGPIGWFLGATALYGVIALVMFLVAAWPILVDPQRESAPLRRRLRLAGLVVIGRPGRLFLLTAIVIVVLAASVVILAGIVLVGVAFTSLLATRWVLPVADELEARYEAARAR
jgi:hypothetical protein